MVRRTRRTKAFRKAQGQNLRKTILAAQISCWDAPRVDSATKSATGLDSPMFANTSLRYPVSSNLLS
jgi:hypothetical protein